MSEEALRPDAEQKRRRRELYIILAVIPFIALLAYAESNISIIGGNIPVATNIFVLGLININIILLVLLIFLVLRNTAKLFFERKSRVMGSRLMTKLVSAFVVLTIVPTFLLFFVVIGFINRSVDAWFDIRIEDSLKEALELAQNYYKDASDRTESEARRLSKALVGIDLSARDPALKGFVEREMEKEDFSTVEVFSSDGSRRAYSVAASVSPNMVPDIGAEHVRKSLSGEASSFVETTRTGDVVRGLSPIRAEDGSTRGVVAVSYYVPRSMLVKMKEITSAFENYKQLQLVKNPVKASYFMILLIITLVIVFFSIWIGRYMAKEITVPIHELAEGTHAVASGNLDYKIDVESRDEIGVLVKSFNRMTEDLKSGKIGLERANMELRDTNTELDRRRHYIEIVLGNVPAGVVSIDKTGKITAINRVASEMLGTEEAAALGRNYKEVLRAEDREFLKEMIREMGDMGAGMLERQTTFNVGGSSVAVLVSLNMLKDENNDYLGTVAVMDDLSHILKTQRMFAWKEVARRIAHEIKNPLTPIQLSAQRLRKKYLHAFRDDKDVFDECTSTIIRQVEELKTLVNEFSSFARMPAANPSPNNLNDLVRETMALYQSGQRNITFSTAVDANLPMLYIDRDQIKRAIINLVDNAIAAIEGEGMVSVGTRLDEERNLACIEVSDTGRGIAPDDRARLFEPYFSTKKSGTGLGLAIVSNIVSDHGGYIRVKDNRPRGTRFIIELPVKTVSI